MKHISRYLLATALTLSLAGCGEFLDKNTSNRRYIETLEDIDELIRGEGYLESYFTQTGSSYFQGLTANRALPGWIHVMDDDSEVNNNSSANYLWVNAYGPIHAWQPNPFIDAISEIEYDDITWSRLYKHINAMNALLVEIDEKFSGKDGFERRRGEVLFLRAFYYFYLVNFYARPYDMANDGDDLGVPLKTTGKIEDKNWERGTVKAVYEQMISDLTEAVHLLEGAVYYHESDGTPRSSIYRPAQAAARHLLARVYLYCGMWDECIEQCGEILGAGYSLSDFRQIGERETKLTADSPEIIFSNGEYRILSMFFSYSRESGGYGGNSMSAFATFRASKDLVSTYDQTNDKRFGYFEWAQCGYSNKVAFKGYYPTFKLLRDNGLLSDSGTFRLAEVFLNMAEAYALKGGAETEARKKINELREMRFAEGSAYEVPASVGGNDLIDLVREERRRELCFEGHRWFDLRRYAVCPVHKFEKEIHHEYQDSPDRDGVAQGYYILPKYSDDNSNWVMPIPPNELKINHGALKDNIRVSPVKHEGMDGYNNL